MPFKDRKDAGKQLASALLKYRQAPKTAVVGLPRGGVVVAYEVAHALGLPLEIVVPRKIGAPENEELAIGALAGEILLINRELADRLGATAAYLEKAVAREKKEAQRRFALYCEKKPLPEFSGWTLLVVDDGIATGYTIRASLLWLKRLGAARLIAAIPVAPPETLKDLARIADEVVCLSAPASFMAVGQFYERFEATEDDEVIRLLQKSARESV